MLYGFRVSGGGFRTIEFQHRAASKHRLGLRSWGAVSLAFSGGFGVVVNCASDLGWDLKTVPELNRFCNLAPPFQA